MCEFNLVWSVLFKRMECIDQSIPWFIYEQANSQSSFGILNNLNLSVKSLALHYLKLVDSLLLLQEITWIHQSECELYILFISSFLLSFLPSFLRVTSYLLHTHCMVTVAPDHTQWHTTPGRNPLEERSARRRDPCLTPHNTLLCSDGIPTHNSSKQTAENRRLRQRGHWFLCLLYL